MKYYRTSVLIAGVAFLDVGSGSKMANERFFFNRVMLSQRSICSVLCISYVCLSVGPSVTSRSSIRMAIQESHANSVV